MDYFNENFRKNFKIFDFLKCFFEFYRNFRENYDKTRNMHLKGFPGMEPRKLAKLLETVNKSMGTCKLLKIFMNYESIFLFKMIFLIIIKVKLVVYWKVLITLKQIKKPIGKSLCV